MRENGLSVRLQGSTHVVLNKFTTHKMVSKQKTLHRKEYFKFSIDKELFVLFFLLFCYNVQGQGCDMLVHAFPPHTCSVVQSTNVVKFAFESLKVGFRWITSSPFNSSCSKQMAAHLELPQRKKLAVHNSRFYLLLEGDQLYLFWVD